MRRQLLDILVCPDCGGELSADSEQEPLLEGSLSCASCPRTFPVRSGVPQMLSGATDDVSQRVAERFGEQWRHYSEQRELYRRQLLDWLRPVGEDFFRGKLVLDAGCGKGRHLLAASGFGARLVVGVDLGGATEVARLATGDDPAVEVVRADLLHLPFRPGTFDYCYSVGVIHHTPEPRVTFERLVRMVRSGGHISAWVYGRENNEWIIGLVNPIRQHLTSHLPRPVLEAVARLLAGLLVALTRGVYRPLQALSPELPLFYKDYLLYIAGFPFREIESIVYDHLQPELAAYIPREQFEQWFEGLEEVTIGWHNANSWRGFARVP